MERVTFTYKPNAPLMKTTAETTSFKKLNLAGVLSCVLACLYFAATSFLF